MKSISSSTRLSGRYISNSLLGSFGKGSFQKSIRKFPRNFRRISAHFSDAIKHVFSTNLREVYAECPQTFHKIPFANDELSTRVVRRGNYSEVSSSLLSRSLTSSEYHALGNYCLKHLPENTSCKQIRTTYSGYSGPSK